MNFLAAADTDIGLTKATNQDSLLVKGLSTRLGHMAFAVLCDGMGGLEKGELASAGVVRAFDRWTNTALPELCRSSMDDSVMREQWTALIAEQNRIIKAYAAARGIRMGTTVVAMLLTETRYVILNVGDSRAYELGANIRQITEDHSFVAREVALGNMTEMQANRDERRNVLLQCVGASDEVYPDMFFGDTRPNTSYLLCSDGFRHEITSGEIYEHLSPKAAPNQDAMSRALRLLIDWNKQRREPDNISAALIRTC